MTSLLQALPMLKYFTNDLARPFSSITQAILLVITGLLLALILLK
jgi:hypothetical protein